MFGLGAPELLLILIIALVVFGPGKLPTIGSALGKSLREFKEAVNAADVKVDAKADEKAGDGAEPAPKKDTAAESAQKS